MEGLEISEVLLSKVFSIETHRLDSEYQKKKYLEIQKNIDNKPESFTYFKNLGLKVDASAFYPSLEPYYGLGNFPFLRVADVDTNINYDNCIKIPITIVKDPSFNTLKVIHKGDIIITKGGSIGRVGLIEKDTAVTRDLIFINSSKLNSEEYKFLFLYLLSDISYDLMIRSSSMTAQPHLTIKLIRDLPIFISENTLKKEVSNVYDKSQELKLQSKELYVQAENHLLEQIGLENFKPSTEGVNIKTLTNSFGSSGRLDAEYYQPKYDEIETRIGDIGYYQLKDTFDLKTNSSPKKYLEEGIKVIKTKNVRIPSIDYENISDFTDEAKVLVKQNDLLFASMGVGSLGRVSFIFDDNEKATVDGTIKILRAKKEFKDNYFEIPALLFLTSAIGQEHIYKFIIGSTGIISISKENIENLMIPKIDISKRKELTKLVLESKKLKTQSEYLLEVAKKAVEIAIEEGEGKGLEYINVNTQNLN
ncbi:restriction endonuclease subunit S [Zhouia amylolytica]|uniref:restriction endonuclease subunit S n=1 Tax=Zhouia amylolytica TaxID=376730 RepID=UPI0020CD0933|nr:restriction endonuclease subunit S [Zhouia amylolytica]MCQ0113092.1 restriction endonuclease subunit S [Zhouia amylolytica]